MHVCVCKNNALGIHFDLDTGGFGHNVQFVSKVGPKSFYVLLFL